jgi:hypothetical protein
MAESLKMKDTFTVKVDGEEKSVCVVRPTSEHIKKGLAVYNTALNEALVSKAPLRAKVARILEQQEVFDEDTKKEIDKLQKFLSDGEKTLHKGGIKESEGYTLAIEMIKSRNKLLQLRAPADELYQNTAENQAENARQNYYLSVCAKYDPSGEPFFKNLDDVLNRINDPAAITVANHFALLQANLESDYRKKFAENKFLLKIGRMNDKLYLLNEKKQAVDLEGRLINEEGRYINEDGKFVDRDGNLISEEGELLGETSPFLDEQGNPIVEASSPGERAGKRTAG